MLYWSFWGMNAIWWLVWVVLIAVFFVTLTPIPRGRVRYYSDPLSILRRRYAAGEITTAEYEERKAILVRDANQPVGGSQPGSGVSARPESVSGGAH
ncbi:MAG TPA: SHOCT domain-containing protein [Polyangia bacterium]|jgi:putative membrane protein|nr:SHOCT domain-containing protein [Polyangia bacterium]